MSRRKLLWTALLIVALAAVFLALPFGRPYLVARFWGVEANLRGANLMRAPLSSANLNAADLSEADLRKANLCSAILMSTDLRGADLRGADLRGALLYVTYLQETQLQGADLRATGLDNYAIKRVAWLDNARFDEHTKWPEGFDPVAAGAVLVE